MNESNSIERIDRTNLTDQTKFRDLSKIKNYFNSEVNQRKSSSKKLSKYVAAFDCIDQFLSSGVSIISFTTAIGAPAGVACKFHFNFFFKNRNN